MVKVTDRFYINATTNQYVLQEKTKVQDENSKNYGNEIFKDLGYYSSLEDCLRGVLKTTTREYISADREDNLKELIKQIEKANEYLQSLNLKV